MDGQETEPAGQAGSAQDLGKRGWYSRGYLPHRDESELTQFVTFRLFDSIPQVLLESWKEELKHLARTQAENQLRSRILRHIDLGAGKCYLGDTSIAGLVQDALKFFHGERYDLLEWVIMPNHVHVLVRPGSEWSLESILHGWKSFTSHEANKRLNRKGAFWYREYYDRWIRNEEHYNRVAEYIAFNPVKARLVRTATEWRWSSSHLEVHDHC